jgi:hypothetical protein
VLLEPRRPVNSTSVCICDFGWLRILALTIGPRRPVAQGRAGPCRERCGVATVPILCPAQRELDEPLALLRASWKMLVKNSSRHPMMHTSEGTVVQSKCQLNLASWFSRCGGVQHCRRLQCYRRNDTRIK